MIKLDSKMGVDDKGFLEELLAHIQVRVKDEDNSGHFASLSGFALRVRRLLKAQSGEIPHAPNDSPTKLWADFSGAFNT
ncbi:hypothetical protein IFT48_04950 [Pseudomonas fluorescens]|uniref:hypothetical protein n=1 Tax=Pseudomonas TaxID=286 RepID=UPI000F0142AE|nr:MULTISPECIES: hypothetical protein [Pseudomonas]MBD8089323.1 hypothetical protein [Pseudomonas fluorescens]MBD8615251.1 hypothetical protein [Pseudomonas putida]MBD8682096.1 hypothetical protein [Pseudomonas sp. CFBP 13719]